ncbi:MAG TPA: DNA/RNA nuclease SfsA [Anaerolineae bacterium]|nr:DNA/RNA nuclease SfsA [Anaerolineae bacterium]
MPVPEPETADTVARVPQAGTLAFMDAGAGVEGAVVEGRFLTRDNRFRVTVEVEGRTLAAHLPCSGRLAELLLPGRRVVLARRLGVERKTGYDLVLVRDGERWVSVDTHLPNRLVVRALREGRLAPLAGYDRVRPEVFFGRSRLDFRLEAEGRRPCLVEVKSVTLVIDGMGCFPDAVTARGRRHLLELASAVQAGYRAAALFIVQRDDARGVRPHDEADPAFGRALREVVKQGVEVVAYGCRVEPGHVEIAERLPVLTTW